MSDEENGKPESAVVVREPTDIFRQFDKLDDEVILAELEGRLTQSLVYHFAPKKGAKEQWGIGKNGVDACSVELAKRGYILRDVMPVTYAIDPTDSEYILINALVEKYLVAKDGTEVKADSAIGTKRQWTKMKLSNGPIVPDPFWYEKGSQKALRNARLRLLPEDVKATIIAMAKKQNKVQEVVDVEPEEGEGQKFEDMAEPEVPKKGVVITIKLSNGKPVTEDLSSIYKRFAVIKDKVGKEIYYQTLGGYEHANKIPYDKIPQIYSQLLGMIDLKLEPVK